MCKLNLLELNSLCVISGTQIASHTAATKTPAATPTGPTAILITRTPIVKVTTTPTQTASSRIPPSWRPETPTTGIHGRSSASAVLGQEWTAVLIAVVVFLGIVYRD